MFCSRCKVETIHINFPKKQHTVLGRNEQPLPEAVERCPHCLADIPSRLAAAPVTVSKPITPQPEQLALFVPTVGGLH